ncbi:hypothetical protein EGI11_03265 [Chryseobacterium sp. H3056]|uniref:Uncharacterized protein n=1 Tax=Kaistella daneshvariae TaxID=2487074 RepID=A0A3N0WYP5_9FLAO|nr:hypothetical protein [Kaistella daneshvariae]ROI09791.1 hypothetical protein EGI11_03265 [Kaistella daneshvariae]
MSKKVQEYFANNPEEEKVFSTTDGFLFKQEMYATAHAATITDKEVTKHVNKAGKIAAAALVAEVPVSTVTTEGDEVRTKDETVEVPTITDSPTEVEGKAEVITEAATTQVEAVKDAAAPKAAAPKKATTKKK